MEVDCTNALLLTFWSPCFNSVGKVIQLCVYISGWQTYPLGWPLCLPFNRGRQHELWKPTVWSEHFITWLQTIDLQPSSIFYFFNFFFYGISCLSLVELVTLLRIVVHHSVDIASFKLLIFRAAGEEGESAEWDWYVIHQQPPQGTQKAWAELPQVVFPLPVWGAWCCLLLCVCMGHVC